MVEPDKRDFRREQKVSKKLSRGGKGGPFPEREVDREEGENWHKRRDIDAPERRRK